MRATVSQPRLVDGRRFAGVFSAAPSVALGSLLVTAAFTGNHDVALSARGMLASLTLVAKEDGARQARNEARGATLGTLGLIGFAAVLAVTLPRLAAVSGRRRGHGHLDTRRAGRLRHRQECRCRRRRVHLTRQ